MKAKEVYFFTNGTTAVFDSKGEQIRECQGCFLDADVIGKLNEHCNKDTIFYFSDWNDKTKSLINLRWWFGKYMKRRTK